MPKMNSDVPLGGIHIKLPFKSMDDVEFTGLYAPYADELVDTLRDHLSKNQPDNDDSQDNTDDDNNDAGAALVKSRLYRQ